MTSELRFEDAGRMPAAGDNVAIATRRLEGGTRLLTDDGGFTLPHTVMEGHRFAVAPIATGEGLLSWGLPFGTALRDIQPGDYICNKKILEVLRYRQIDFELPAEPNFTDYLQPYTLDEAAFRPGQQVAPRAEPRTFPGFRRGEERGVGTRNFVIVLGTSSRVAGFCRALEERFKGRAEGLENVDGIVAVTHTEGGGEEAPNNREFVLRALAGFMVHPNVGAVLAVDYGDEPINNRDLRGYLNEHGYPLQSVIHSFFSIRGDFTGELERAEEELEHFLPNVNRFRRTPESVAHLKLALQCGGSDAFSGVSGNPLAGWVAKEVIRNGGAANLGETDELIGAEPYVLSNVKDMETAQRFLHCIERFKARAELHGHSAEGNPSGGNNYRGLYNIAIKSIGAARKKDPEVRLDAVIDYAERMTEGGYYFMDSPGNDLESIAGQVASGANLILFITGNGSITNFPFVPTLKFVTTTGRWQMLANEMDVNAGRYQDGTPMDELGAETFELALRVAGGQLSLGEQAGHAQVQIWRDWRQTEPGAVERILNAPRASGEPLHTHPPAEGGTPIRLQALRAGDGYAADRVGLVLPTSLCSGQVARMIAEDLSARPPANGAVSRYVALVHTEGCGAAPGYSTQLYLSTVLGHLTHPMVGRALLLEHGCEQTHNDAMRHFLQGQGVAAERLGWASVQLDGGIEAVMRKARAWFAEGLAADGSAPVHEVGLEALRLGLTAVGPLTDTVARGMAQAAARVVHAGGLVVVPENSALLRSRAFREALLLFPDEAAPTLEYGQPAEKPGLHIMHTPTAHFVETATGLGATGVEVMLAHVGGAPLQSHPMIPLLQVSADAGAAQRYARDLDRVLDEAAGETALADEVLGAVAEVASRRYTPRLFGQGNTDFQLTRGFLGLSL